MTRAQGRKARDDRYYQANKDAINRRRRERRQRKRERDQFGAPRLKLVERLSLDHGFADLDPANVTGDTSSHGPVLDWQPISEVATNQEVSSLDEPSMYQKAMHQAEASDYPEPACLGADNASDRDVIAHSQTEDSPATDQAGSDLRASDRYSAPNCDETVHGRASDQNQPSDPRTSDQKVTDYTATDYETEPTTTFSYEGMKNPPMENLRFQENNVYTFPVHSELKLQKPAANSSGRVPLLVGFHLIVTLCLATLGTCLQFEFYREHDVLPGYALPLAIAGAASMLALATVRFPGFRDWPRKSVYAAFYVFIVASSSYHVLSKTWDQSAERLGKQAVMNVSTSASGDRALEAMTNALKQATKNRAYKTMGFLGAAVGEKVKPATPTIAAPEPVGISHEAVKWTGAVILIVLRALLEAAQAIGATALRSYFRVGRNGSSCMTRAAGTAVS